MLWRGKENEIKTTLFNANSVSTSVYENKSDERRLVKKYLNCSSIIFRNNDDNSEVLSYLPINTELCVYETNGDWTEVVLDDEMIGYIKSNTLSSSPIQLAQYDVPDIDTSFKTFTDYKMVTDKTSKQYEIVQNSYTDNKGMRRIKGTNDFVVALGTYYTKDVGERFLITLESGVLLYVTVGDIKSDEHTENSNRYIRENGNVVEFYIDSSVTDKDVLKNGDISCYTMFSGNIVTIEKLP